MGHVLARLNGFGMALVPQWPYSFEREQDGSDAVRITRWTASGPVRVVVQPGQLVDGGDVVDIADGLNLPYWLIETSVFRVGWPAHFTVDSPRDAGDGTPFYLQGPGQATIFPQGPVARARLADPDALVASGQTVLGRRADEKGGTAVELGYRHEDEQWWQAHWLIPFGADEFVVITAQSLEAFSAQARRAAEMVVGSFEGGQ